MGSTLKLLRAAQKRALLSLIPANICLLLDRTVTFKKLCCTTDQWLSNVQRRGIPVGEPPIRFIPPLANFPFFKNYAPPNFISKGNYS